MPMASVALKLVFTSIKRTLLNPPLGILVHLCFVLECVLIVRTLLGHVKTDLKKDMR